MGIGVGLFLFAIGAILTWAVNVETSGLDLDTVGLILMIIGAVGFFSSLLIWGPPTMRSTHDTHVVEHTHEHHVD